MQKLDEAGIIKLSNKLIPKKINKPKVYKLCGMGLLDYTRISEETNTPIPSVNPYVVIEGIESIVDKFEEDQYNQVKVIENIVGTRVVKRDGKSFTENEIAPIEFINGVCVVKPHEFYKYLFLERSNNNASNPFRDKSKPKVWEAVEDEKEASQLIADAEVKDDAILLSKTMSLEEARAYAQKLNINIDRPADAIRWDLRLRAEKDPKEFIKGSKDAKAKRKIQIMDAKAYGIIRFDAESNNWIWPNEKHPDKRIIMSVPIGSESPEAALDNFFIEKDGKGTYQKMVEALKTPEDYL